MGVNEVSDEWEAYMVTRGKDGISDEWEVYVVTWSKMRYLMSGKLMW